MKIHIKNIFFILFSIICSLMMPLQSHAQTTKTDRTAYQQRMDSLKAIRIHNNDSVAAVRKYHQSKKYKKLVAKQKKAKEKAKLDAKKNGYSSTGNAKADSIHAYQKHKMDSLANVRKYKTSKRYTDSVAIAHRERADSIAEVHQHFSDSLTSARKHKMDSATAARKKVTDSIKFVRNKRLDSIKLVRKSKTDSLNKVKTEKEKLVKAKEKKKQDEQKLKLEIKFKQKREAWSNKSMLKKNWSPQRRLAQNAFTHYNYYYNANKKMDEALANMQRSRKENYDSLISLFSFDPNRDSAKLKGDMDTIIRKTSIGIQIHDPREKWANDMYLLMGEAYYYKGNYDNASTAFKYIITKDAEEKKKNAKANSSSKKQSPSIMEQENHSTFDFLKHKSVHNDVILWLGRTYTSWHKEDNAESVISLCESDRNFPENLKGRLALEKAFLYLNRHNYPEAIKQLDTVAGDRNVDNYQRMRAAYLCGQLKQEKGDYAEAVASFENVLDYHPKMDMEFYTRKNIAFNSLLAGNDAGTAMKPLKKVLKDPKYSSYYDQIYYVLGKLAVKAGKTDEGIGYLNKSIATPKATKKQKAYSFAAMGDAYYSQSKYVNAKHAYDSSSKYLASGNVKDTALLASLEKKKGLNDVVTPLQTIHDQDSLLDLAEMSKKEQLAAVRRYLKKLQQDKEDSISNAADAGVNSIILQESPIESSELANWYFSNPSQMTQGSAEFKRKWGNRPLTDNWRRASAQSFAENNNSGLQETYQDEDVTALKGLPSEASLLAKIPATIDKKDAAMNIEQKAYIALAKAYFNELEDNTQALAALNNLVKKFPDHKQKEEELYLRYQIAIKQNQLALAQSYSDELLKEFPKSKYGKLLKPKEEKFEGQGNNGIPVAKFYEETYNLLIAHQYTEAQLRITTAKREYNDPLYKKRFLLAEAMANAGSGNFDKSDSVTNNFLHTYPPPDTLAVWAMAIKNYVSAVRKNGVPDWYNTQPKSNFKDKSQSKTTNLPPTPPKPLVYQYQPEIEHISLIILPGMDSRISTLKNALMKLDSTKYSSKKHEFLIDFYSKDQTILVIKKFANADSAKTYNDSLLKTPVLHDYSNTEYKIFIISSNNYTKLYTDKNIEDYENFYKRMYIR